MGILSASFGDCELDAVRHELRRGRERAHLTPKAFALLQMLIERRPALVSKDEIMEALWPGVFVAEANVPNLVSEIREALGDRGDEPRFIRTVYRLGYSFVGDVQVVQTHAADSDATGFCVTVGTREIALLPGENMLGRGKGCRVPIASHTVSRQHACIRVEGERALLVDLGSKNGTLVGGRKVHGSVLLAHDDEIRMGEALVRFSALDSTRPTETHAGTAEAARSRRRS